MRRTLTRVAIAVGVVIAATLAVAPASSAGPVLSFTTAASGFGTRPSPLANAVTLEGTPFHPTSKYAGVAFLSNPWTLVPESAPATELLGTFVLAIGSIGTSVNPPGTAALPLPFTLAVSEPFSAAPLAEDPASLSARIFFTRAGAGGTTYSDASSSVDLVFTSDWFRAGSLIYTLGTESKNAFVPLAPTTGGYVLDLSVPGADGIATTGLYAQITAVPEPATFVSVASALVLVGGGWGRRRLEAARRRGRG
jgi:hypothetical protein